MSILNCFSFNRDSLWFLIMIEKSDDVNISLYVVNSKTNL